VFGKSDRTIATSTVNVTIYFFLRCCDCLYENALLSTNLLIVGIVYSVVLVVWFV